MKLFLLAKDALETQGIRWMLESHFTGIELSVYNSFADVINDIQHKGKPDLAIIDMDKWQEEESSIEKFLQKQSIHWLGLSSERIFQTAYRGLRFRAQDVLFRPLSPVELMKQIQQLRFQLRNERNQSARKEKKETSSYQIDYADFFLTERVLEQPVMMSAFLTPNGHTLPLLYDTLQHYPFSGESQFFAFSSYILCVHEAQDDRILKGEFHAFLSHWKERFADPLAIIVNDTTEPQVLKGLYQKSKQLTELVFFEGYDIIILANKLDKWRELDPFLTPVEQREWIEMLEKRDTKSIQKWVEHEFLMYEQPYPDPEMVRVRLTSVLAQIRRYMKSYQLQNEEWDKAYHEVFQQIVRQPVVYQIVQTLLAFITKLMLAGHQLLQGGAYTLVDKTKALIESNYWDAQWNLAACAETIGINKSTLSRRFAAEAGQTFRDTLHHVRIREAKRLLKESDLPLEEIARLTGYTHQTYFNAKFKQLEKCTPTAYRLQL
ncbi:response regulator transcription factor [Bacillus sp. FJAT-50079]|uniref:helix-turn-helix transcriptional regulator n=1 Tax=Bacillus sp. FJAT-50079 TaxID=2833577 RepID=UPI001BC97D3F|nr:response regulator transcription factor [Bacillus sp. FJAT-50079]MBS4210219.1 helix-turn-helix transcriptional regulator [Bacillus sp. FJAT-50079]